MHQEDRRRFLKSSLAGAALAHTGFLAPLGSAAAASVRLEPGFLRFDSEMAPLVRLIQRTPREACARVFVDQLRSGLTYPRLLAGLFLAATQTRDLHQIAQIYGAHRTSSALPETERLLPLFWAMDRVKQGQDLGQRMRELGPDFPSGERAEAALIEAMERFDPETAERAVVGVARAQGARRAMDLLLEHAPRNLSGTLGHLPIGVVNAWRTLDAVGWAHAEPALRYMAIEIARFRPDRTFGPNADRVERMLPLVAPDWAGSREHPEVTRTLFDLMRTGDSASSCDYTAEVLSARIATAGAIWDAVALTASEVLFRYETGGNVIGGNLVHAVTSTNALRFGFGLRADDRTRLLLLLQAVGVIADWFVGDAVRAGRMRDMNLIDDLDSIGDEGGAPYEAIFAMLPPKGDSRGQLDDGERAASDQASRMVFANLSTPDDIAVYQRAARGYLVRKATEDAHDIKYPAAAFEDVSLVSERWRPYLLAASVHALHGERSADSVVFRRVKEAVEG